MKKSDNMLDFGGSIYYIDIDNFVDLVKLTNENENKIIDTVEKILIDTDDNIISKEKLLTSRERDVMINQIKYEMLRDMLDIVLDQVDEVDEDLGVERALKKSTISYKIAFNTLINYKILVEID
jgi:hypothetical protein